MFWHKYYLWLIFKFTTEKTKSKMYLYRHPMMLVASKVPESFGFGLFEEKGSPLLKALG